MLALPFGDRGRFRFEDAVTRWESNLVPHRRKPFISRCGTYVITEL